MEVIPPQETEPARDADAVQDGQFRVALLLPLSGPQSGLGEAFLEAAQVALFDIDHPGFLLLPRDVGNSPEEAAAAAETAIADGAQLILGPIFSASVTAAGDVARRHGVPVIGFSNNRAIAGDGVFLTGFTPLEEVRRIIDYAVAQGHREIAALIPETAYGDAVSGALQDALAASPIGEDGEPEVVLNQVVTYPPANDALFEPVQVLADYADRRAELEREVADLERFGENDDLAQQVLESLKNVETLGELTYDAVLIPEGGGLLHALAPLLPYYEIDPANVQFLGTALWDDATLTREPSLYGAWFAAPPTERRDAFEMRFRALYGDLPPRIATLAYDALALAAGLGLPRADDLAGRPLPQDLLMSRNGFQGLDGIFRFTEEGLAERGLAIKEITQRGIRTIVPAPTTFQAQSF